MQPGDTISPGAQPPEKPEEDQQPQADTVPPGYVSSLPQEQPAPPEKKPQIPSEESNWQFKSDDQPAAPDSPPDPPEVGSVNWTASEYVAHHKGAGWFFMLALGVALLAGFLYVVTREIVSSIVVVIIGIAFGMMAMRQPRVLSYAVDGNGLQIGQRFYPYAGFKAFSITEEGGVRSITLMPLQRFMPPISVYYEPKDEAEILGVIGAYLPNEELRNDYVERLMRKIRF
jgi:hypothetical protein